MTCSHHTLEHRIIPESIINDQTSGQCKLSVDLQLFTDYRGYSLKMLKDPIGSKLELAGYLKILSLFGYWPRSHDWSKISRIFVTVQIAMAIYHVGFAMEHVVTSLHDSQSMFSVASLIRLSYISFILLTPLVSIFETLVNRERLLIVEKSLIDLQRCLGMPLFEIDPFLSICTISILVLTVLCLINQFVFFRLEWLIIEVTYLLNFFNNIINAVRFVCLFATVAKCFSRLTSSIKQPSCQPYTKIKRIIRLQTKIKEICTELNDIFNVQIILLLFYFFYALTTQFRLWLSDCTNMYKNIDYAIWTVFFAMVEIMIIHTGQKIINGANLFSETFFNYVLQEEDENLIGKPIVLLYVTGDKKCSLRACNFADIDHKLGLTLSTACITYFIVLLQFKGPEEP